MKPKKMRKITIRVAVALVITCVVAFLLLLGVANYLLVYAFSNKYEKVPDWYVPAQYERLDNFYPQWQDWFKQTREELTDTFFEYPEGVKMHALLLHRNDSTNRVALLVHGYHDNAIRMLPEGRIYAEHLDCNLLIPDLYAHGFSNGVFVTMGYPDREFLLYCLRNAGGFFGRSEADVEVVVHGLSMGAFSTMVLSGEDLPKSVKCMVEDCGYSCVYDELTYQLKEQFGMPEYPLMPLADWLCGVRFGWTFKEATAEDAVRRAKVPMLFIHGDADGYVPFKMMQPLYDAYTGPKEQWVTKGTQHARSLRDYPEEYEVRVVEFAGKYLH